MKFIKLPQTESLLKHNTEEAMQKLIILSLAILIILSSCKLKDATSTSSTNPVEPGTGDVTITVVTPNGGEILSEGSAYQIQWTGTGTLLVKIQYSIDNGTSWGLVVDSLKNTGIYNWFPVPNTISNQCRIMITSSNGVSSDQSDKVFAIVKNSNESLKINSPNGGESWEAGSAKQIKWYSSGLDSVRIEYTTDNGLHWNFIAIDKKNTGIFYWEPVPNTPSTLAKVRIMDAKDGVPSTESTNTFTILPESILRVLSPNGGEKILAGTSRKIEWVSENIENVKIAYTTNNGFEWKTIIASTPATGFYIWSPVPNINSQLCKIRIYDAVDGEPSDVSDSVFTITNQISQTIEVTSPNGGEKWQAGTSQNITWTSSGVTKVKIEFTSNNGLTWNTLIDNLANTGAYEWNIPNSLSTQCLIKISDAIDGDPADQSNAIFRITPKPELKILYPIGGETWTAGIVDTIRWSSIGVENVFIDYTPDNGISWTTIVEKTPSNGKYGFSFTSPGSLYKVRIIDADNKSPVTLSNGTFTVLPEPKITVLAPNGNEEWYAGSSDNIKWTSTNIENVKIEYTTNNGATWVTITNSTPSTGAYSWNPIPNVSSLQCRIRISEATRGIPSDISDNNFTITYPGTQLIKVTSPNGGEKWTAGSSQQITWDAAGITNVKIEYTLNNGISWNTITASTPSTGFYTWNQVPNTLSTNCKIRISDATDSAPSDESDQFFSIVPAPDIKVTSPNGGETIQSGNNFEIRWTSESVENVKIEYTINGGAIWNTIISSTPSIGSYVWTNVPSANSYQCKIRISDAANGSPFDVSDNNFTISNQTVKSIKVISPNGGEKWREKQTKNITWSSSGIDQVNISFTTDGGRSWNIIANNLQSTGSYDWTIPALINSTQCKIRISDSSQISNSDESDATFSILLTPEIQQITFPTNGTELIAGQPVQIQWTSTGITSVKIEYNYINVAVPSDWITLVDSVQNSGTYNTSFSTVSDNYVIRISASDKTASMNSGVFKVKPAGYIQVLAPNGTEQWLVSTQNAAQTDIDHYHPYEIRWNATYISKVKIEWSTNGGGNWYIVPGAANTENDGIFVWAPGQLDAVRPDSSDNCKIRITSADAAVTASDQTDGFFSIHESKKIRLEFPNNGEDFYPPTSVPPTSDIHWPMLIRWTSYAVTSVNIYYSLDDGVTWTSLATNYQSTGAYSWDFLLTQIENRISTLGRIKIVDNSDGKIWDVNDIPFWLNVKKVTGSINKDGNLKIKPQRK